MAAEWFTKPPQLLSGVVDLRMLTSLWPHRHPLNLMYLLVSFPRQEHCFCWLVFSGGYDFAARHLPKAHQKCSMRIRSREHTGQSIL
ncbi:hypothetical protein TNCV_2583491 [Trichonephila clavipes]|nr:hypothetical protein TNCV_2583491 [Trichonephila clavipes]